jgi:hypothetical protein
MKLLIFISIAILFINFTSGQKCYSECEYQCSRNASDCLGQCALNRKLWKIDDPNQSDMAGCLGTCRTRERSCYRTCKNNNK